MRTVLGSWTGRWRRTATATEQTGSHLEDAMDENSSGQLDWQVAQNSNSHRTDWFPPVLVD